ncbi:HNH endonuclease signature motif containing protein [Antrihabitans cavernicola]|uniref:HNH endonuclease n=1 Tax=Antrihabitans cavernicola TaxID=2495913 RepID=A0A5A7SIG4_9NOCA|nr:HNH endonuclease signature motif containing protein [Spelaeibacter cavernicola]KAA0024982.1 HNH endonuclease [Spelaeibacter cavernicola]
MSSIVGEMAFSDTDIADALTAVDAGMAALAGSATDALSNRDRVLVLQQMETWFRMIPGIGHTMINQLHEQRGDGTVGEANVYQLLQSALRISPTDAARRVRAAKDLGVTTTMTGEQVAPDLVNTAAAQRDGAAGTDHVRVIRRFLHQLPAAVDTGTRAQAEAELAGLARELRPDELGRAAERLAVYLNPDGTLADENDRARQRCFRMGPQGPDKMSKGSFVADPELRAYLEAVFAKYAKPGVCNPEDPAPTVDDDPEPAVAQRDTRSTGQRQHDALKAMCRAMLASGQLGQHRGLPVTTIISMTLQELETASGVAVTGGGSLIPIRDALRMARHAHHYLAIFDDRGRPLYLGRSKRVGSGNQRIVLHVADGGCTFPGCPKPGYLCQTHHGRKDWAQGGETNIDELTFACDEHHPLAGAADTDWHTIIAGPDDPYPGRTYWIPPTHIDPTRKPRINHYHHPGEYLTGPG